MRNFFVVHQILIVFLVVLDSSQWELSVVFHRRFLSIIIFLTWFCILLKTLIFHIILKSFFVKIPYAKCKQILSSRLKYLSSRITVFHLLCTARYFVQQNTVSTLTQLFMCATFSCQRTAIASYCACKADSKHLGFKFIYIMQ